MLLAFPPPPAMLLYCCVIMIRSVNSTNTVETENTESTNTVELRNSKSTNTVELLVCSQTRFFSRKTYLYGVFFRGESLVQATAF